MDLTWKPDWPECQRRLSAWWRHTGFALCLEAWRPVPRQGASVLPPRPLDLQTWWTDPVYRATRAEAELAGREFLAEAFPYFDTQIGPGSLGIFLGSEPGFAPDTVWYNPCLTDPAAHAPIQFSADGNHWLEVHLGLVDEGLRRAGGRYLVGIPDLIENLDTLSALRGDTALLYDLLERPSWVAERLAEINQAYFAVFDLFFDRVKDAWGGNAFSAFRIWGPGKTAKLQCDASAMISPRMFRRFVIPHLGAQCDWLDFSLYHLDGTTALQHLDALLEIPGLDGIEWTPQALSAAPGGSAEWYDLYRRIKAGGKSVQVIGVRPEELLPLLDAIGPQGTMVIMAEPLPLDQADALLKSVESYR
jgi:hypothetical protein